MTLVLAQNVAENHEFKVSVTEADYLKLASRDESFTGLLKFQDGGRSTKLIMQLSRAEAEQLRECLTTQLAAVGFDEDYEPNEQGQMLEDLIDRFFIR
jgi:hypothetical protein